MPGIANVAGCCCNTCTICASAYLPCWFAHGRPGTVEFTLTRPDLSTDTVTATVDVMTQRATCCWEDVGPGDHVVEASDPSGTYGGCSVPLEVPDPCGDATIPVEFALTPPDRTIEVLVGSSCWDDFSGWLATASASGGSDECTPAFVTGGALGWRCTLTLPWADCTYPDPVTITVAPPGDAPFIGCTGTGEGCPGHFNCTPTLKDDYACCGCGDVPRPIRKVLEYSDDWGSCTLTYDPLPVALPHEHCRYTGEYSYSCEDAAILDGYGGCARGTGTVRVRIEAFPISGTQLRVRKYAQAINCDGAWRPIDGAPPGAYSYMTGKVEASVDCSSAPAYMATGTLNCWTVSGVTYCPDGPFAAAVPTCLAGTYVITGAA